MKIYLVGGAVRDALLGIESEEKDWVVVGACPKDMLDKGFKPVGRHFPVFIHPTTGEEYALARTERKVAPGYHGFEFNSSPDVTLEEDLARRDLTINAIAKDDSGRIIDPWGGVDDIEARKLRHISEAFAEDPVRILRVARFRAKLHRFGFVIQDETLVLMQRMTRDGEADHLVAERVWAEAEKTLRDSDPSWFFVVLHQVGVLDKVFPELKFLVTEQSEAISDCLNRHATQHPPEILFAVLAIAACKYQQSLIPLCQRLKLPQRYLRFARIAMQITDELPHSEKMPHSEILKIVEACDGVRRTDDFTNFLNAWLLTDEGIPRAAQRLFLAIEKLKAIDFKTLLKDSEAKEPIHQRVQEIKLQAIKDI